MQILCFECIPKKHRKGGFMRKYIPIACILAVALFVIFTHIFIGTARGTDTSPRTARTRTRASAATADYIPFLGINRYSVGNINRHIPRNTHTDFTTAEDFARRFDMPDDRYFEDDYSFFFLREDGAWLRVYRNTRQFLYVAAPINAYTRNLTAPQTDAEIVTIAASFMDAHDLANDYNEARVHRDGEYIIVTFHDHIGNLPNFAFNNTVTMDQFGHVLALDYFFIEFERLGAGRVKTQHEALQHLPSRAGRPAVHLTDGQLVQIYANSIVQPAYFFEGETACGETFAWFVKASVY